MSTSFAKVRHVQVGPNRVAYREVGDPGADPLLLIHGYPLSGLTFRHAIPRLAQRFRCLVPDLPGAGATEWADTTDFSFAGQAETLRGFADALGLTGYRVLAHDTGATIARQLTLIDPARATGLVLIGTEIPDHRPPYIELFQRTARPKQTAVFRLAMRSRRFRHSAAGFGGVFWDASLIDGEFFTTHIEPVLAEPRRIEGLTRYLLGIDWKLVDGLAARHAEIGVPVLLVWGEEDTVFPIDRARQMVPQFGDCRGLVAIPRARAFVHEEHPDEVARISLDFFAGAPVEVA